MRTVNARALAIWVRLRRLKRGLKREVRTSCHTALGATSRSRRLLEARLERGWLAIALLPQPLAHGQRGGLDLCRHGPAKVAVVPWLVLVAGDACLALGVTHHPAVLPGVVLHPSAGLGVRPVAVRRRITRSLALEIDRRAQLVLRVAGARGMEQSRVIAQGINVGREEVGLRGV